MSADIPSRMFASTTSYQHGDELTVVGVHYKNTYRLDKVGQRGAVLRVAMLNNYGTQNSDVGWIVVRPADEFGRHGGLMYATRRNARRAVEA